MVHLQQKLMHKFWISWRVYSPLNRILHSILIIFQIILKRDDYVQLSCSAGHMRYWKSCAVIYSLFPKAQCIFMTNPQRMWVRRCCAFTSGDSETYLMIHQYQHRELNISVKLLRCLNIKKLTEKGCATFTVYFALFSKSVFPLCLTFILSGQNFCLWLTISHIVIPDLVSWLPLQRLLKNEKKITE